jgi:helix-turn-helix protein
MAYNYTDVVFPLKGLNPVDKLVLLHLAEHADKDTGECWPGFGRLADYTGLTRRTVIYSINRLEERGLICNHGSGGKCEGCGKEVPATTRNTNTYVVRMDKLVAAGVAPATKRAKRKYDRKKQAAASTVCCDEFPNCICDEQEMEFLSNPWGSRSATTSFDIEAEDDHLA